jgi:putative Ca2+/H+ antiporter (TMEM165/GDT1 family)
MPYRPAMDWRALLTTFGVVFLAELGDKTQLATFALSASGRSKIPILIGAASALVLTSVIAVVAGAALGRAIPPIWLRRGAGALMLALGALMLLQQGG